MEIKEIEGVMNESYSNPFFQRAHVPEKLENVTMYTSIENEYLRECMSRLKTIDLNSTSTAKLKQVDPKKLLDGTKKDILALSNRLSKLMSKKERAGTLERIFPNEIEADQSSVKFFKIEIQG